MIGAKLRIIHENCKKKEKNLPKIWYISKIVVPLRSSNVSINSSNIFKINKNYGIRKKIAFLVEHVLVSAPLRLSLRVQSAT